MKKRLAFRFSLGSGFGVVLKSKLEPKSTKNRLKTVSRLRCKFECIFEGSWTPVGPILEAKMGPSWGHVGPMLALGPLKKSIQKTSQTKNPEITPRVNCHRVGGPLEQRKKRKKGIKEKRKCKRHPTCAQGAVVDIYVYLYVHTCVPSDFTLTGGNRDMYYVCIIFLDIYIYMYLCT